MKGSEYSNENLDLGSLFTGQSVAIKIMCQHGPSDPFYALWYVHFVLFYQVGYILRNTYIHTSTYLEIQVVTIKSLGHESKLLK